MGRDRHAHQPIAALRSTSKDAAIRLEPVARKAPNRKMRTLFLVIGIIALLIGLIWTGQGAGLIQWPAESFMINQSQWMWYGASTAFGGLLLILVSRKV